MLNQINFLQNNKIYKVGLLILAVLTLILLWLPAPVLADDPPTFDLTWGSNGSGSGQFSIPDGIAVDNSGNIYVVDRGNKRVQKFDSSGNFILQWGSAGSGPSQFNAPMGIAVHKASGYVYVADSSNNRIQKFTPAGGYVTGWSSTTPQSIAVDNGGYVYVTEYSPNRVVKFTPVGGIAGQWGNGGSGPGQFNGPRALAIDSAGYVYVADTNNHRIQKFTPGGGYVLNWGGLGSGDGQLNSPFGVAVDSGGNVYVTDFNNFRVQKFDSSGNYLTQWGTPGSGDGQFDRPHKIATDNAGNIYVTDFYNHRVQKFNPPTAPPTDVALAIDDGGAPLEVYVGESFDLTLQIQNATDLYAAQTECGFDQTVIFGQASNFGNFFDPPPDQIIAANNLDNGTGTWLGGISQKSPANPLTGNGELATLTYQAVSPAPFSLNCANLFSDRDGFELTTSTPTSVYSSTLSNITILDFATLDGTVTYQGRLDHAGINVIGTGMISFSEVTVSSGAFTNTGQLKHGGYNVSADAASYLPICLTQTITGSLSLPAAELPGGDINADEQVSLGDATLLTSDFNNPVGSAAEPLADINNDGDINILDLAILAGNYNLTGCQTW